MVARWWQSRGNRKAGVRFRNTGQFEKEVRPAGLEPAAFGSATTRTAVQAAPARPGRALPYSEATEPASQFVRLEAPHLGGLARMWAETWAAPPPGTQRLP